MAARYPCLRSRQMLDLTANGARPEDSLKHLPGPFSARGARNVALIEIDANGVDGFSRERSFRSFGNDRSFFRNDFCVVRVVPIGAPAAGHPLAISGSLALLALYSPALVLGLFASERAHYSRHRATVGSRQVIIPAGDCPHVGTSGSMRMMNCSSSMGLRWSRRGAKRLRRPVYAGDISTHSLIFRPTFATGGRDVIVDVRLRDRHVVSLAQLMHSST